MGTRHITCVLDEDGKKIIEMYGQFDGYPEGMGQELKEFIDSGELVNGLQFGRPDDELIQFNGMGCFSAQLVANFKVGSGGFYLNAPTTKYKDKREYGEMYFAAYYYEIDHELTLTCWNTYEKEPVFKFKREDDYNYED